MHEAAHATVALLIGFDFDAVTLPEPTDDRIGLSFSQYDLAPGEEMDAVFAAHVEARITVRLAGEAIEGRLCGAVRFAGADILAAQHDSLRATSDEPAAAAELRKLCKERAYYLVARAHGEIGAVADALLEATSLDWSQVAEIVFQNED
ncbi:MAG: hypothetical protein CL424_15290 [Acidimicrobiaceae bacterium]|nr:hypothetical protein [Acidimicrobiaceae bacterium]